MYTSPGGGKRPVRFSLTTGRQLSSQSLVEHAHSQAPSPFAEASLFAGASASASASASSPSSLNASPAAKRALLSSLPSTNRTGSPNSPGSAGVDGSAYEVRRLQQEVSMARLESQRLHDTLAFERTKQEKTIASREAKIAELEKDRKFLYEGEARLKEELVQARREAQKQAASLETQLASEKKAASELRDRLVECSSLQRQQERELQSRERQIMLAASELRQERENFKSQSEAKDQLLLAREALIADLKQRLDSKAAASKQDRALSERPPSISAEQLDRLHKMEVANRRLVQENAILRDSAQACRLLEEKIHTYERRVEGYREVEKRYFELEIELEQVKKELASSSHREKNPPSLPPLSHRQVRELMEKTAELIKTQESLGEIESKYSVVRSELEKMHTRVAAAEQGREEMARHLADLRLKLHQSQQLEAIRQTEEVSERVDKANSNVIQGLTAKLSRQKNDD